MKIIKFLLPLLFFFSTVQSQDIYINEFCASNSSILTDANGEYNDWIEIYNRSSTKINLHNYSLSDDSDEPRKWIFPPIDIGPNEFLVVFASGENDIFGSELHTNFKIKESGEPLILTDNQGITLDILEPILVPNDNSYARISDGNIAWQITAAPTPKTYNFLSGELTFSHPSGFYSDEFSVTVSTTNTNQEIYFTRDGSTPTQNSSRYTAPLLIKPKNEYVYSSIPTTPLTGPSPLETFIWKEPTKVQTMNVLRFAAFENGQIQGKIHTKTYFIGEELEKRYEFPVVNITTDSSNLFNYETGIYIPGKRFDELGFNYFPSGNYLNEGRDWERDCHITYFEKGGKLAFESDGGIRMHGNGSASFPQKSFKIYFREEYGQSELNYPIFKDSDNQKYKRLLFRNGGNDFLDTHFKDAMLQNLISGLDVDLQAFQPSIVFINGEYWGIHNIREKYDRFHFQNNFGIDKDSINVLKMNGKVEEGGNSSYLELIDFVEQNDCSIDANYNHIKERIDISNFIDFQIAEIYLANYDWPCNNFKIWKSDKAGSKWRFAIYDLDFTFGFDENSTYRLNSFKHATSEADDWPHCPISNAIFRNLLTNENFKTQFIERFVFCLKNTFKPSSVISLINDFENLYANEIEEHIDRWHYPKSMVKWQSEINNLKIFASQRPCYVKEHLIAFFQLDSINFDCKFSTPIDTQNDKLSIFPNPTEDHFTILNEKNTSIENASLTIFNFGGQKVFSDKVFISANDRQKVNIPNFPSGVYYIQLTGVSISFQQKIFFN